MGKPTVNPIGPRSDRGPCAKRATERARGAGGETPGGRFGNVFKFRDGRISSLHIYLDPDYTGEDEARFRWGKNRKW